MKTFYLHVVLSGLCFIGCKHGKNKETTDLATATSSTTVNPQIKLYDKPGANPKPGCDIYTAFAINVDKSSILLLPSFDGDCPETGSAAQPREYSIIGKPTDNCGTKVYQGKNPKGHTVKVVDHRNNTCGIQPPASVLVEETIPPKAVRKFYSSI